MKSARARWRAHRTLGATRRWTTTGYATAQWKARSARRCQPPPGPTLTNVNFLSFCGGPNPCPLDQSGQAKHHHFDPRKQTPGGRHQIGTPAGFKSESVAGFLLECVAGFVGIRIGMSNAPAPISVAVLHYRLRERALWAEHEPMRQPRRWERYQSDRQHTKTGMLTFAHQGVETDSLSWLR